MNKNFVLKVMVMLALSPFFLLSGCSKDSEEDILEVDPFYKGALATADINLLNKYWSVYEVNYDGRSADVEQFFGNCDRDFFTFFKDGSYKEYLIQDSSCIPHEQELQWTFDEGVITLENSFKDYNEMVVVELTANKFLFRAKYDVDEDGKEDVLQFLAKPYIPNENYFYSNNLLRDESLPNKISLEWSEYEGINQFQRYEIYLSGPNCQLSSGQLLTTITDQKTTSFEDENPPFETFYCYFLKVYTDKGLLFESYPVGLSSDNLNVPGVALNEPTVENAQISLEWEKYEGLYFSHYEVVLKNHFESYGYMSQEQSLGIIYDINTISFVDETPPIVKNPVYEIRVFNKFGKQNYYNPQVAASAKPSSYVPERLIDVQNIINFAPSPTETVVFLNGRTSESHETYIVRYNYVTKQVEAISNTETNQGGTYTNDLKVITSPVGQEVMYSFYDGIAVFDAQTLHYKYSLQINNSISLEHFIYLGNDRYVLIDDQYVYTVLRDFSNLTVLDKQEHFTGMLSQNWYGAYQIGDDKILIGNSDFAQSVSFNINTEGKLIDKIFIDIPITATKPRQTVFNGKENSIVNFKQNRIYDLNGASYKSFEQPYFPLTLGINEDKIIGVNNNESWDIIPNSLHEKNVRILDLNTQNLKTVEAEGYPQYLFENHLGQLLSISTYFKRSTATWSYDRPDFFVELIPYN